MAKYYYKVKTTSKSVYGGRHQTAEVFKNTKEGMKLLGEAKWNTAGYKGASSEVLGFLKETKQISKKKFPKGYYGWSEAEKHKIKIEEI